LEEAESVFDLYLTAYDSAKGRVGTRVATHTHEADRHSRRRQRFSESMNDAVSLSTKATALGLIEPEAHAETQRIGEALKQKFGAESVKQRQDAASAAVPPAMPVQPDQAVASAPVKSAAGEISTEGEGGSSVLPDNSPSASVAISACHSELVTRSAEESVTGQEAADPALLASNPETPGGDGDIAAPDSGIVACMEPEVVPAPVAEPEGSATSAGVHYEKTPPRPVRRHDINRCWPEHFAFSRARLSDPIRERGVDRPIVMIGDEVLDGWGRYTIARELGIEYPVVQYDGDDALLDSIRWNLDGTGRLMTANEFKNVALRLAKLPDYAHRASEIAELFGLELEGGAA